ncbi:gamma-glutamyl-gamma-aminobutyrate hydrolase family protein [Shewanella sp. GXUN23E]|uniref:gamma-glutamyl-gamma-aminobutyrate hydrolase family protein n=1 Tax=Shewanella sp. GXUN23E TaxID=3422498 RepID=UPI003D7D7600
MSMGQQNRNGHPYQVMTHKYMQPIVDIAGCIPLLVPSCFGVEDLAQYLDMVDGVYVSGAASNIDPALYGQENLTPDKGQDANRDHMDMALIHAAIERKLPILGICRGMQELNIALGGDLYQKVHDEPHLNDHRENPDDPPEVQYGPSHSIDLVKGCWLHDLLGDTITVNSLHGQGVNRLGKGLEALAYAEDGLVEAIHMPAAQQFVLGVQWHPEWQACNNPDSVKIFRAFGEACQGFHRAKGEAVRSRSKASSL